MVIYNLAYRHWKGPLSPLKYSQCHPFFDRQCRSIGDVFGRHCRQWQSLQNFLILLPKHDQDCTNEHSHDYRTVVSKHLNDSLLHSYLDSIFISKVTLILAQKFPDRINLTTFPVHSHARSHFSFFRHAFYCGLRHLLPNIYIPLRGAQGQKSWKHNSK